MKVSVTAGAYLSGDGIGNVIAHSLAELDRRGWLLRADNLYYEGPQPRPAYIVNHTLVLRASKCLQRGMSALGIPVPLDYCSLVRDRLFDASVALTLPRADAVYGWSTFCRRTFRRARRQGAVCVLENPATHRLTFDRLVQEELDLLGLPQRASSPVVIERALEEYDTARLILVQSDFARQTFLERGVQAGKLVKVHLGCDLERFRPHWEERERDSIFRLLFVGEVGVRKGALYLLRAWEKLGLPNAELCLVGPVRPDVARIAATQLARDDVKVVGFDTNVQQWFARSDALALPSLEDGWGMVVVEAMASGMPVIATGRTGASEMIADGETGYVVDVRDVDALAERIETLYRDPALRRAMGGKGRVKAEGRPWETYGREVADAIGAAVEAERGSA